MRRAVLFVSLLLCYSHLFAGSFEDDFLKVAEAKDLEELKSCLSYGINVNCTNAKGETALIIAARQCWEKGVEVLLRSGFASIDYKDREGKTALIHSVEKQCTACIETLVEI